MRMRMRIMRMRIASSGSGQHVGNIFIRGLFPPRAVRRKECWRRFGDERMGFGSAIGISMLRELVFVDQHVRDVRKAGDFEDLRRRGGYRRSKMKMKIALKIALKITSVGNSP
jgi:hypothetical protein